MPFRSPCRGPAPSRGIDPFIVNFDENGHGTITQSTDGITRPITGTLMADPANMYSAPRSR